MGDNSTIPVASGTEVFANKDIGGVKFPKHITTDSTGAEVLVATAAKQDAFLAALGTGGPQTAANSTSIIPANTSGATPHRVLAAATTNASLVKASAGLLRSIDVFNLAAYTVFLKFYDKASAPTVGTDTPVWTVPLLAGSGYSKQWFIGRPFAAGIAYAITKNLADTDTTAIAVGDVTGDMLFV